MSLTQLGKQLKSQRILKGMSYARFGREIGVTKGTVWNWETGKYKIPLDKVEKVAETLGIEVTEITKHYVSTK